MTPAEAKIRIHMQEGRDRMIDIEIGRALGWRVSRDEYWNWRGQDPKTGAPIYDPPGDEWCIRRDGRSDIPCNEALPNFTAMPKRDAIAVVESAVTATQRPTQRDDDAG